MLENVKYGFDIECLEGVNILFWWLGKVNNFIELKVRNCLLIEFYGDYESKIFVIFFD